MKVWGGRGGQEEAEVHIPCSLYPLTPSNTDYRYHLNLVISALFVHSEQAVYLPLLICIVVLPKIKAEGICYSNDLVKKISTLKLLFIVKD